MNTDKPIENLFKYLLYDAYVKYKITDTQNYLKYFIIDN